MIVLHEVQAVFLVLARSQPRSGNWNSRHLQIERNNFPYLCRSSLGICPFCRLGRCWGWDRSFLVCFLNSLCFFCSPDSKLCCLLHLHTHGKTPLSALTKRFVFWCFDGSKSLVKAVLVTLIFGGTVAVFSDPILRIQGKMKEVINRWEISESEKMKMNKREKRSLTEEFEVKCSLWTLLIRLFVLSPVSH